jgi:hypothetical protein
MLRTPLLVIALLVLPLASGATQLTAHITRLLIAKKRVAAAAADPVPFEPLSIEPVLPAGAAQLAWATPLLRFDVGKGEAGGSAERLNSELRAAVLADFDAFRQQSCPAEGAEGAAGEEAGCGGGDPANAEAEYNRFFEHQLQLMRAVHGQAAAGTALPHLGRSAAARRLHAYLQQALDEFLLASGAAPEQVAARPHDQLFVWANVQGAGVSHRSHVHERATVSGTYYVAVPGGAGRLLLEDPRGALPPFGKHLTVAPAPGALLLWPAWLAHGVSPNLNATHPRISLSFNWGTGCGERCWERTADVAAVFAKADGRQSLGLGTAARQDGAVLAPE